MTVFEEIATETSIHLTMSRISTVYLSLSKFTLLDQILKSIYYIRAIVVVAGHKRISQRSIEF